MNKKIENMIYTALMIALVFVSASVIKIPTFNGFIHLGDSMVFLSVLLLGKNRGTVASAFGMLLVDVFAGYMLWAPFTFIIKGVMAYVVGTILEKVNDANKRNQIIAFSIGAIVMIVGYFIAGAVILAFLSGAENVGLIQGVIYSAKDIVGNIIQGTAGVVIAVAMCVALQSTKLKSHLYFNK